MVNRIESSIDVHVPASTAYEQWTRFEELPRFMRHVEEVQQLDGQHLRWRAKLGREIVEWDARIVEQVFTKRIAWRCSSGARHAGAVTFQRLSEEKCRVKLWLEYDDQGMSRGVPRADIQDDLRSFANFIEARKTKSGGWRSRISPRFHD